MADLNLVVLEGRLTKDPELRYTAQGKPVCGFSLAVNGFKEGDVSFFDCEAWDRAAELVSEYMKKGRALVVQGRLKLDRWETEDGTKRSKVKIVVKEVQFRSSGTPKGEREEPEPAPVPKPKPKPAAAPAKPAPKKPVRREPGEDELPPEPEPEAAEEEGPPPSDETIPF